MLGELQSVNGAPSSEHSCDVSGAPSNSMETFGPAGDWGAAMMRGAVGESSTIHENDDDADRFPDGSAAKTSNVCTPSGSSMMWWGDVHGDGDEPSSEHSKVTSGSSCRNPNTTTGGLGSSGASVRLGEAGASESTTCQEKTAGGETFPAASFATTLKL